MIEASLAFPKPLRPRPEFELPTYLPRGYFGEVVPGDRTIIIRFAVCMREGSVVHERIEPPIELSPETYACTPGGEEIGLYDAERLLVGRYRRGADEVWRPVVEDHMTEDLPAHIVEAMRVLVHEGRAYGITVDFTRITST